MFRLKHTFIILNSDRCIREALTDIEVNCLDEALLNLTDVEKCKNLINNYLLTLMKEDSNVKKRKNRGSVGARKI